jgi:glyoxylase-like metal-dependent hydrolase (beta-lactamase superfamily II)
MRSFRATPDVTVLSDHTEVPGLGFLPVNAFVLHAAEPVVIDTGLGLPGTGFLDCLGSVMDPADVRWIWLTHPDRDHTGALFELLEVAPNATLVTTFVAVGIMSCERRLPLNRIRLVNPGETLDVGDRTLTAFRPPLFDNPATVAFYEDKNGACFSSDCFGAPLASAVLATGDDAGAVPDADLRAGQLLWASVDSPWVHSVDEATFGRTVDSIRTLDPSAIFSTHLPPAVGRTNQLVETLLLAPTVAPFVGPNQQALEQLLSQFEPV